MLFSMKTENASKLFEKLSSPNRLAIFQLLTLQGRKGMIAGDLAKETGLTPNNLSFHLKGLCQVGLVYSQQEGRFVRYYADIDLMKELVSFLTKKCCQQNGETDQDCIDFCH